MKRMARVEDLAVLGLAAALITLWISLCLGWVLRLALNGRPGPPQLPLLTLGLVLAGAYVTRAALRRRQWPPAHDRRARWVVGFAGAIGVGAATVLALPLQFGVRQGYLLPNLGQVAATAAPIFLAHLFAWLSGIRLGRAAIGHRSPR